MKGLADLIKTTLIGGLLVVLPIYLSVLLLATTLGGLLGLLAPVTAAISPDARFRQVAAILIVLVVCLVVGLLVRTTLGLRAKEAFERSVLEKIPGYTLVRSLASRLSGDESEGTFRPALVELEDALSPAFIIEELEDGRYTVTRPVGADTGGRRAVYPAARARASR